MKSVRYAALLLVCGILVFCAGTAEAQENRRGDINGDGLLSMADIDAATKMGIVYGDQGTRVTRETFHLDFTGDFLLTVDDLAALLHIIFAAQHTDPSTTPGLVLSCELADTNGNGILEEADNFYFWGCYLFFHSFGAEVWAPFYSHGDFNGDQCVDIHDWYIIRDNWGGGPGGATIPDGIDIDDQCGGPGHG